MFSEAPVGCYPSISSPVWVWHWKLHSHRTQKGWPPFLVASRGQTCLCKPVSVILPVVGLRRESVKRILLHTRLRFQVTAFVFFILTSGPRMLLCGASSMEAMFPMVFQNIRANNLDSCTSRYLLSSSYISMWLSTLQANALSNFGSATHTFAGRNEE